MGSILWFLAGNQERAEALDEIVDPDPLSWLATGAPPALVDYGLDAQVATTGRTGHSQSISRPKRSAVGGGLHTWGSKKAGGTGPVYANLITPSSRYISPPSPVPLVLGAK